MATLKTLSDRVHEMNDSLGWSAEAQSWGDSCALLNSEVAEALEAWRDHRLDAFTTPSGKPDDVASEVADCVVRLLDICRRHGVDLVEMDLDLADVTPTDRRRETFLPPLVTFGDWDMWLAWNVTMLWQFPRRGGGPRMLRALVLFAERMGIDLPTAVERKIAFNATRPFQHGGRTVAGELPPA